VGKELVAREIHRASGRGGRYVTVNVAGLDDQMFSDTLFGHRKGAFTGADQPRAGLIAEADGGTIFLDEIGDLNAASQVKLLRLLQQGEYHPLGSDTPLYSQARVVAATNHDLKVDIVGGSFRKDLYYRLCAHQVRIPPLRERRDDLPLLLEIFLDEAAATFGKARPSYPRELLLHLSLYDFPGNVRQLKAMVFDAMARHGGGMLSLAPFRAAMEKEVAAPPLTEGVPFLITAAFPTLQETEQYLIGEALDRAKGNQGIAASLLGISRQALNKRLSRQRGCGD
jgi:DNA-binding NtrC family response regulator